VPNEKQTDFVVLFGLLKELEAFLRLLPDYKTEEAGNFRFHRAEMQLFGPAFLRVELAEEQHHERAELSVFLRGNGRATAGLGEDPGGHFGGTKVRVGLVHSVVGKPAAVLMKIIVPRAQGGRSSWRNCVLACTDCNHRKGGRTPDQARSYVEQMKQTKRYKRDVY
jgi:hypothetical protein